MYNLENSSNKCWISLLITNARFIFDSNGFFLTNKNLTTAKRNENRSNTPINRQHINIQLPEILKE